MKSNKNIRALWGLLFAFGLIQSINSTSADMWGHEDFDDENTEEEDHPTALMRAPVGLGVGVTTSTPVVPRASVDERFSPMLPLRRSNFQLSPSVDSIAASSRFSPITGGLSGLVPLRRADSSRTFTATDDVGLPSRLGMTVSFVPFSPSYLPAGGEILAEGLGKRLPQSADFNFDLAAVAEEAEETRPLRSPTEPLPSPVATQCYAKDQLVSLSSLTTALFSCTPESIFSPGGLGENDYVKGKLNSSLAGWVIPFSVLEEQFNLYNQKIFDERKNDHLWLRNEKMSFFTFGASDFRERTEAYVEKKIIRNAEDAPQLVLFMGDIHGSVHALLRNLLVMKQLGYLQEDFTLAANVHLVFLGDLTDRGLRGAESIYTILRLKNANWMQVHIARGNHEDGKMIKNYGFVAELSCKYAKSESTRLYELYAQFCTSLPSALFLGFYEGGTLRFMQACHGGIAVHHDPRPFLAHSGAAVYEKISYASPHFGSQYEWNDVCCTAEDQHFSGCKDDAAIDDKLARFSSPETVPFKKVRGGDSIYTLHRDDVTKLLHRNGLFMLARGHQDQHAPCKVLREGEPEPVSWRLHEAFSRITPQQFLRNGIALLDSANCWTMTTATEARGLVSEGFIGILFAEDFSASRVWIYEADLLDQSTMDRLISAYQSFLKIPIAEREAAAVSLIQPLGIKNLLQKSRNDKYVSCKPLADAVINGSAGDGSDEDAGGTIQTPAVWHDDAGASGCVEIPLAEGIHMPKGDTLACTFGHGTVRDALGIVPVSGAD